MTVRAKQTVHYGGEDGATRTVGGGQEYDEADELVKDHPDWFETTPADYEAGDKAPRKPTAKRAPRKTAAKEEDK